jgi:NAD/NADP transhydrogenase beta subunit
VLGTIIGIPLGKVAMTAVPQRTALSHAFGALCVTLVGTAEIYTEYYTLSLHDALGTDPAARKDARVVEVEVKLDDSAPVAGLTQVQVEVTLLPTQP